MTLQFAEMMSLSIFFWGCFVKFSYWSKFEVNIIDGSGVMPVYFQKGLTRNMELFMKSYWMLQNGSAIAVTVSELLRENQQGVGKITLPLHQPSV